MKNKEKLDNASRAAGIEVEWHEAWQKLIIVGELCDGKFSRLRAYQVWSPLTDDGDALRLAVKLRLWVQISERSVWVAQNADEMFGEMAASTLVMFSDCGGDKGAAVRLAIVRAEI